MEFTAHEADILAKVVPALEELYGREEGAEVSVCSNDKDDYVDFEVRFADGEEESLAVERRMLSNGSSILEICYAIA